MKFQIAGFEFRAGWGALTIVEAGQIDNSATVTSPDPFDTDAPPLQDMDTITTPIEPLTIPFMHPLNRILLGLVVMLLGLVAIARAGVRP